MKNKIITLLFILFSSIAFSQLSKTHYIPPITSGPTNANPEDQYLYISTPNKADVNVTINIIGGGSESKVIFNDNPGSIQYHKMDTHLLFRIQKLQVK